LKKQYTSILTLICTAVTLYGFIIVYAWRAYADWIPTASSRLLLSGMKKGWDREPHTRPIHPHLQHSRSNSFSDLTNTFTFSDEASTNITARISLLKAGSRIIHSIWGGIRSSIITTDITAQRQSHDPENPLPARVAEIPSIPVSPFRLAFPSQPQRILKYAQLGDISDMEYSPGGFVLAVTR
jgi:hypothetical protein